MKIRKATLEDIPVLSEMRKRQLMDEGFEASADMDAELSAFFHRHLADGSMVEWLAEEDGEAVATGAIIFYDFPPAFFDPKSIRGYLTNLYTAPAYRRQGIGGMMMDRMIQEAKDRGAGLLWLGASKMGRPLYLKKGFKEDGSWLVQEVGNPTPEGWDK